MTDEQHPPLAGAHALGILEGGERAAYEEHIARCLPCRREADADRALLARVAAAEAVAPAAELRGDLLALTEAPAPPVDLSRYSWAEVRPGIRIHVLSHDPVSGARTALVWGTPGARYPAHRHLGSEQIFVIEGALRDHRGIYGPGEVCRSRAGSVHAEEVVGDEDCVCLVVHHGGHEPAGE